eukprot:6455199-Amphidinium_carterae.2
MAFVWTAPYGRSPLKQHLVTIEVDSNEVLLSMPCELARTNRKLNGLMSSPARQLSPAVDCYITLCPEEHANN